MNRADESDVTRRSRFCGEEIYDFVGHVTTVVKRNVGIGSDLCADPGIFTASRAGCVLWQDV